MAGPPITFAELKARNPYMFQGQSLDLSFARMWMNLLALCVTHRQQLQAKVFGNLCFVESE